MTETGRKLTVQRLIEQSEVSRYTPDTLALFTNKISELSPSTIVDRADTYIDHFYGENLHEILPLEEVEKTDEITQHQPVRTVPRVSPLVAGMWERLTYAEYVRQRVCRGDSPASLQPFNALVDVRITLPQLTDRLRRQVLKRGNKPEVIVEPFVARVGSLFIRQLDEDDMRNAFFDYHRAPDGSIHNFYHNRKCSPALPLNGVLEFSQK